MKIVINGVMTDTNVTPVALVFSNDTQREQFIKNIQAMPPKPGVRVYCEMPDDLPNKQTYFDNVVAFVVSAHNLSYENAKPKL